MLSDFYASLDPIAFSIGPIDIRWYGLAYLAGFICAGLLITRVVNRWKIDIDEEDVLTIVLGAALGVLLGGRIGYVLFYGDGYYFSHLSEVLAFNQGGMSFHGGLVGALVGGAIVGRVTRIPYLTLADLGAIAATIGLFFGRCANFVNGELWGKETDLPWGVVFPSGGLVARHPSQLYEAVLEGLVILLVLYLLSRKYPPRPRGTFIGMFLVLYGLFRILIEFVRVPDVQLGYLLGGTITMGQVLSLPLILAGSALLVFAHIKRLPQMGHPVPAVISGQDIGTGNSSPIADVGDADDVNEGEETGDTE